MFEFVISWETLNGRHYSRYFSLSSNAAAFGRKVRSRSTTKDVRMRLQHDLSTPDCARVVVLDFNMPF